jgi:hypothetical protein
MQNAGRRMTAKTLPTATHPVFAQALRAAEASAPTDENATKKQRPFQGVERSPLFAKGLKKKRGRKEVRKTKHLSCLYNIGCF